MVENICTIYHMEDIPKDAHDLAIYVNCVMEPGAFQDCSQITKVVIDTPTVPECAFMGCLNLSQVIFTREVTTIHTEGFAGCLSLAAVDLNEIKKIGQRAFQQCNEIKTLVVPSSVEEVGQKCFDGCPIGKLDYKSTDPILREGIFHCGLSLHTVDLSKSLITTLGAAVFKDNQIHGISLPPSLKEIGDYCFENSMNLELVELPSRLITIGWGAFKRCRGLKQVTVQFSNDPDKQAPTGTIGQSAFAKCKLLKMVSLPNMIRTIDSDAFLGCIKLEVFQSPSKLEQVGKSAFEGCTKLVRCVLPDTLRDLGASAFHKCLHLPTMFIAGPLPTIAECVFEGCIRLQTVKLPDTVRIIKSRAFRGCIELYGITFPRDLEQIDTGAFCDCPDLRPPPFPQTLRLIGPQTFKDCVMIKTITIPQSVVFVGFQAFAGCIKLETADISGHLKIIADQTFKDCNRLKRVRLPPTVEEIGDAAFAKCSSLADLNSDRIDGQLPFNNLKKLGNGSFAICQSLPSIEFPQVTTIGTNAFSSCLSLSIVILPQLERKNVASIFEGCTNLASIVYSAQPSDFPEWYRWDDPFGHSLSFTDEHNLKYLMSPEKWDGDEYRNVYYEPLPIEKQHGWLNAWKHVYIYPTNTVVYTELQRTSIVTLFCVAARFNQLLVLPKGVPLEIWFLILNQLKLTDLSY